MFIDKTSQQHSYNYSLIQYSNNLTGELFNLGVVMNYEDGHMIHLNDIKQSLLKCIDIGELSGINYSISLIHERLEDGNLHIGNVSNVLKISQPNIYTSSKDGQATFQHLVNEFISLKKMREVKSSVRSVKYGKMQIISSLRAITNDKNLMFHHHIDGMANIVDASYIKDGMPRVVAQITSPHTKNFYENIATSAFMLSDFNKISTIEDKFIYSPVLVPLSVSDQKKLDQAIEASKEIGVDIITKKNHDDVVVRLRASV